MLIIYRESSSFLGRYRKIECSCASSNAKATLFERIHTKNVRLSVPELAGKKVKRNRDGAFAFEERKML